MTGPISALEGFEGVAEFRMTKEIAIESYRKSLYLFFFFQSYSKNIDILSTVHEK